MDLLAVVAALTAFSACGGDEGTSPAPEPEPVERISTDAELLELVLDDEPFTTYALFPDADSIISGTLDGSGAHQPMVRVRMNAKAMTAIAGDTLPSGASFPDSSIIFKQIGSATVTTFYAVMYKDRDNPLAANGWLWGEYRTNGTPLSTGSIQGRGAGCVSCHSRQDGPINDFVRTFERQNSRSPR